MPPASPSDASQGSDRLLPGSGRPDAEVDRTLRSMNVAARIAEYARPGEVLVSQAVVDASDQAGPTFTEIGPVELKGVVGATHLYAAHRGETSAVIDG